MGSTRFGLVLLYGSSINSPRIAGFGAASLFLDPLFIMAAVSVAAGYWILYHTPYGLRLRATGEDAATADSAGINVQGMRYSGVLVSGLLAALGGAFLVFQQHTFTDNMTAGRGYIALAAMIIGRWNPLGAALASLFFAAAESLEIWTQGGWIPSQLLQSIPYVVTLLVLAGFMGIRSPPVRRVSRFIKTAVQSSRASSSTSWSIPFATSAMEGSQHVGGGADNFPLFHTMAFHTGQSICFAPIASRSAAVRGHCRW